MIILLKINMKLNIYSLQLSKNITLSDVEQNFKMKFTKSIDASFYIEFEDKKQVYFYKFGAIVFLWFEQKEIDFHVENIIAINGKISKKTDIFQEYEIQINKELEKDYSVKENSIFLKEYNNWFLEIIAFSLAHTVAMEYYENTTEAFFQKLNFYEDIKKFWEIKVPEKTVLKNIAELLSIKHEIVNELYLLDKPDIIWDDIRLEHLYNSLYNFFDITDRFKAIEYKLNFMSENISFLHELIDSKKAHFLELIIIRLIMIEIIFTLIDFTEKYLLK